MKIERLGAKNYDEIISLLNVVFTRQNGRDMDFEKEIPKMCVRDEENMSKHFGIFEDGKLVACMGVYPFDVTVGEKRLRFATTGNVAVHWDSEGKGYMGAMMDFAMSELERTNIDAARLGGLRSRYNRYGFEACGQNYTFTFTQKNRERKFPQFKNDIEFREITATDTDTLEFCVSLYNKNSIAVVRSLGNAYASLSMWRSIPYIAFKNGTPIGYLCTKASGNSIAEIAALDTDALADVVCAWQARVGAGIDFSLPMYNVEAVRLFAMVCESSCIQSPSHFKIRNWDKVIDAFMKLKASCCKLMPGELYINITDYGSVRLFVDGEAVGCERTEHAPDITLDKLEAARYIFGPYPPVFTANAPLTAQAWFPLPLSWNGQDRV